MLRNFGAAAFTLLAAAVASVLAVAPSHADDVAGEFDFYVLALSWSPSYCASEGPAPTSSNVEPTVLSVSWCTVSGHRTNGAIRRTASSTMPAVGAAMCLVQSFPACRISCLLPVLSLINGANTAVVRACRRTNISQRCVTLSIRSTFRPACAIWRVAGVLIPFSSKKPLSQPIPA